MNRKQRCQRGRSVSAEHECGSKKLQSALCAQQSSDEAIIAALKRNEPVCYPRLLDTKRITKYPSELQFSTTRSAPPGAVLGFARNPLSDYYHELHFPTRPGRNIDMDVAGAWDEGSFAIRVRGEQYVEALTDFYAALRAGKVLFAGLFLQERVRPLAGVVLANSDYLTEKDFFQADYAQVQYEKTLRLKAKDESKQLMRELQRRMNSIWIGYLWPVWSDSEESEVLYAFNSGHGIKAEYCGLYAKEDLLAWADAGGSYQLPRARG